MLTSLKSIAHPRLWLALEGQIQLPATRKEARRSQGEATQRERDREEERDAVGGVWQREEVAGGGLWE